MRAAASSHHLPLPAPIARFDFPKGRHRGGEESSGSGVRYCLLKIKIPSCRLTLLVCPIGATLAECDPFGIPSTSHWTGAAIIVQFSPTQTCIVTRSRIFNGPMRSCLAA